MSDETVLVLAGGLSHERDVSLRSGRRVSRRCGPADIEVIEADVDSTLVARLAELPDAVVFPLLHGETGEDGALREVFALLGVPFVASIASASRVAFDKSIATTVIADAGIATPVQVALPHEIFRELGAQALVKALGDQLGFPMMVKPSRERLRPRLQQGQPARAVAVGHGRRLRVRPGRGRRGVHRRHRGRPCRGGPRHRAGRPAGGRDPAGLRGLRLHRPLHRRSDPLPLPGRGVRRHGGALRRARAAGPRGARARATCPGPTSSSPRTACRSSWR